MPEGIQDEGRPTDPLRDPTPTEPARVKFEKVPLHLIDVDPRIQLRAKLRDSTIDELAASAKKIGILHPIHVERKGHRFRLIMGHRRFVAARRVGMTAIDAFVVERRSDEEAVTIALSENVLRENLSPLGVGLGCLLLSREHAWSYAELSELIGISLKSIQRRIRVADRASPAVKAALHERSISNAHALAILRLPSEKQEALLQEVLAKGFPSRETERRVKETLRSGREEQRAEIVKEVGPLAPYARVGRTNRADEHELAIRYHSLEELLERLRGVSDRLRDRSGLPVKTLKPISARPRPKSGRSTTRRKSR